MRPFFLKYIFQFAILILVGLFVVELVGFFYVLTLEDSTEKADAVVVFAGSTKRIEKGFLLFHATGAEKLIVSPAAPSKLNAYNQKYGPLEKGAVVPEPKARTTFENALLCRWLIQKQGFQRVLLVTSAYHMPRSYFLMKLVSFGSGTRIHLFKATDESENMWQYVTRNWKVIYNEMIELWGSLFEGLYYKIFGELPSDHPGMVNAAKRLKAVFLFHVRYSH